MRLAADMLVLAHGPLMFRKHARRIDGLVQRLEEEWEHRQRPKRYLRCRRVGCAVVVLLVPLAFVLQPTSSHVTSDVEHIAAAMAMVPSEPRAERDIQQAQSTSAVPLVSLYVDKQFVSCVARALPAVGYAVTAAMGRATPSIVPYMSSLGGAWMRTVAVSALGLISMAYVLRY